MTQTTTRNKQVVRVPVTVRFFDTKTGNMVHKASSTVKTKIRAAVREGISQNPNTSMECTVTYSKEQDSWNAFSFTTMKEFDDKLAIFTEMELLRDLLKHKMLEPRHLEKRKLR
jgi:uncharacterized protein YaaR (DUF327 family)